MTTVTICMSAVAVIALLVALILDCTRKQDEEMSFEKKELTKKQLIEKMHEERRMWMDKVEYVRKESRDQTLAASRRIIDAVLSSVIRAFGTADGEAVRLDINVPEEREGYTWKTKIQVVDEKTWRLWAQEMKDPEPEKEKDMDENH